MTDTSGSNTLAIARQLAQQAAAACAVLLSCQTPLQAQVPSVALAGIFGGKALVVVDGSAPKSIAVGETYQGVRLISTSASQAVIERAGQRQILTLGEAPLRFDSQTGSQDKPIILKASSNGHFTTSGMINGRNVQFLVDTGASVVAMSSAQAEQAGIDYKTGQAVQMGTANGITQGWRIKLASVRIGSVEVFGVDAVVTPQPMPYLLLGNSFLSRFQLVQDGELLTLSKRY